MKKFLLILTVILSFVFYNCNPKQRTETLCCLADTIPMQCNEYNFFLFALKNAVINDSLQLNVFFDTGLPGKWIVVSDSLQSELNRDSIFLQIGKTKMLMEGVDFVESNRSNVFNVIGKNTIIAGWRFFENKIIELSFDNQYVLVHEKLPDITEYSKTKIDSSNYLFVTIEVVLQGKTIKDKAIIDTGAGSYASFSSEVIKKYDIDITDAYHGETMKANGLSRRYSLFVDTIKIGDLYVAKQRMRVGFEQGKRHKGVSLLGVRTLENFSVVLDLIDYNMYLKPLIQQE